LLVDRVGIAFIERRLFLFILCILLYANNRVVWAVTVAAVKSLPVHAINVVFILKLKDCSAFSVGVPLLDAGSCCLIVWGLRLLHAVCPFWSCDSYFVSWNFLSLQHLQRNSNIAPYACFISNQGS
jgi:hypothetical protein